jgi:hypothetical protein
MGGSGQTSVNYADLPYTGSKNEVKKYDRRRLNDLRWEHRYYVRPQYLALLLFISFELRDSYHHAAHWIRIKVPEIMHELFTRDFYCQLKANDMDLSIALTKLESLIFDDTLNTATPDFSLEDLMNEQTSYSGGRNFSEWIRAIEPLFTYDVVVDSMIRWWYRLEGVFKTRIAFPDWFRPFRPSDAPRLSEQFVTPPSGMANQVQQLTQGRSALKSSAGSGVCGSTQVTQRNEILAPTMANMRLQNPAGNVNHVGGYRGIPGPVPFNANAAAPYNPEVRINPLVYPQMPTHSPMEIENTPSFPSFCAGMTTPVSSAYITPTMQNSPPPPPIPQLHKAFSQLPRPTATIQPGHIVHFAHPSIPPVKQMDWACPFHLQDELHRQYFVLKCNNHNCNGWTS